jgi:hypothetical protein
MEILITTLSDSVTAKLRHHPNTHPVRNGVLILQCESYSEQGGVYVPPAEIFLNANEVEKLINWIALTYENHDAKSAEKES